MLSLVNGPDKNLLATSVTHAEFERHIDCNGTFQFFFLHKFYFGVCSVLPQSIRIDKKLNKPTTESITSRFLCFKIENSYEEEKKIFETFRSKGRDDSVRYLVQLL